MELCYQTDVSMKDFLLGRISPDSSLSGIVQDRKSISRYMTTDELEKMESVLHLMLNEDPPVSLCEAERRLARHFRTIKNHFPELFLALKERRFTYESERLDRDKIKSFLLAAIDETPPRSLRSIATQLGCSCGVLRCNFREETTSIVERYAETRKVFVDPESVRVKFQALQTEAPPLSIAQCAERLGCAPVHLYKYFPDVCRLIGSRYANYRKENARQRRESRRQVIIDTKIDLEAEGINPTSYRIRKRLPHIKNLTLREINIALKELTAA